MLNVLNVNMTYLDWNKHRKFWGSHPDFESILFSSIAKLHNKQWHLCPIFESWASPSAFSFKFPQTKVWNKRMFKITGNTVPWGCLSISDWTLASCRSQGKYNCAVMYPVHSFIHPLIHSIHFYWPFTPGL